MFQTASGRTRRDKERNACTGCAMLDTKTTTAKRGHAALERLARRAMVIRRERTTGYPRPAAMMSRFEYGTLHVIEDIVERQEIKIKRDHTELLMMLNGVKFGSN